MPFPLRFCSFVLNRAVENWAQKLKKLKYGTWYHLHFTFQNAIYTKGLCEVLIALVHLFEDNGFRITPPNFRVCSRRNFLAKSETLQNLPYFIYTKTQSCFFYFSFNAILLFSLMNALVISSSTKLFFLKSGLILLK